MHSLRILSAHKRSATKQTPPPSIHVAQSADRMCTPIAHAIFRHHVVDGSYRTVLCLAQLTLDSPENFDRAPKLKIL